MAPTESELGTDGTEYSSEEDGQYRYVSTKDVEPVESSEGEDEE